MEPGLDELPLAIRLKTIGDFLNCPVCMCMLDKACMTMCGHRFCTKCILECIDRHHKCPICNTPLRNEQVFKDPTYDEMIATIKVESDRSEKQYFDQLITSVATEEETHSNEQTKKKFLNPIEAVLKKHLKTSFSSHNRYYQDLSVDFDRRFKEIESECHDMISDLREQGLGEQELHMQTEDIEVTYSRKKEALTKEMSDCGEMVAKAFDRYLEDHLTNLSVLPIQVTIQLLDKNISLCDIQLQPADTLSTVRTIIERCMEEKGDKVISFSEDVQFVSFGPFSKRKNCEMRSVVKNLLEGESQCASDVILLQEQLPLVLHLALKPGSVIAAYGKVKLTSDLPKSCFTKMFVKGKPSTMDYFTCITCNFNWVCRPCFEECHSDHVTVPLIMNHQPTWACCYCPKKSPCKLQKNTEQT